ncbi:hypothetical protein Bbelb_257530 [Branchiostoma belcheri]|nr:hypothetical protein Bbelb_257530 [Branchiostoma belcheri]
MIGTLLSPRLRPEELSNQKTGPTRCWQGVLKSMRANNIHSSSLDLEEYEVEDESDPADGWSPLDTVWSDAMNDGRFYLGSRDNIRKLVDTKLVDSLYPPHGMDNREIIPSSKQILMCRKEVKGRQTCKLEDHNTIRHYQTCALVANSGILTGSLCGGEIDAHDYVIRFSVAPTVGYELDVGSKRNVTFLNKDILLKINQSLYRDGPKDVYSPRLKRMNASILVFARGKRREWMDDINCLIKIARKHRLAFTLMKNIVSPAFTIRNTVKATMPDLAQQLGKVDLETTGMLALYTALTFCTRISLYGFYPFLKDANGRNVSYHYYPNDDLKNEIRNFSVDYAISQRYDKLGVIRHVIDRCEQTPLADKGNIMEEYYNLTTISPETEGNGDYTPLNKDEVQDVLYEIPEPLSTDDPTEGADLLADPSEDDPEKYVGASEEDIAMIESPQPTFTLPWKICLIVFVLINVGVVGFLVYHVITIGQEASDQSYRVSLLQHKVENLVKNLLGVENVKRKENWLVSDPSWAVLASGTPGVIDNRTFDARKTLDGDVTTHWDPAGSRYDNDWYIVLDLKSIHDISKIALTNYGDTTHDVTEFSLQASVTSSPYEWRDVLQVGDVQAGTNREGNCEAGYKSLGKGCFRFSTNQLSFEDSRKICREDGGHLAIVKDSTTHAQITDYIRSTTNGSHWIGLQLESLGAGRGRRGLFFWEDGTLLTGWKGWREGEPSSLGRGGSEDCVEMADFYNYEWNDQSCNDVIFYICQTDKI